MATKATASGLLLTLTLSAGCLEPQGLLFTRKTVPYSLPEQSGTRVGIKRCHVDTTQLKEPFTRANLSVLWTHRAVAEAVSRAGMTEIRYVDIETLAVLNGMYARRRLIFHGE
jgi:hypothetical protein